MTMTGKRPGKDREKTRKRPGKDREWTWEREKVIDQVVNPGSFTRPASCNGPARFSPARAKIEPKSSWAVPDL